MSKEIVINKPDIESEGTHAPTPLSFNFRGVATQEFADMASATGDFVKSREKAIGKNSQTHARYNKEKDRLAVARADTKTTVMEYASYVTASAAYLKIAEVLGEYDVNESDVAQFFIRAFKSNTLFNEKFGRDENTIVYANSDSGEREQVQFVRDHSGRVPSWFRGNKYAWMEFFARNAFFTRLLNRERKEVYDAVHGELGYTSKDWIPDWMDDIKNNPPDRVEIEQELAEDMNEWGEIRRYYFELNEKLDNLKRYYNGPAKKSVLHFEKRRRELLASATDLPKFILYMNATSGANRYAGNMDELVGMDFDDIQNERSVPFDSAIQLEIDNFIDEAPVSEELASIWLEKKFRQAGIFSSGQIDEKVVEQMSLLRKDRIEDLKKSRESDKRVHKLLNYELKPLTDSLSDEEMDYFIEFVESQKGEDIGVVINELGYMISMVLNSREGAEIEKYKSEVKKFSKSFIRGNQDWLREKLIESFNARFGNQTGGRDEEIKYDTANSGDFEFNQEWSEETIEENDFSSFSEWTIYYTPDRDPNSPNLSELDIQESDDSTKYLENVLVANRQQVNIKNTSVINALEWATSIPQDILATWPKKDIEGNKFLKIKRGSARIFVQLNPDDKRMVFFVHQKKAWTYGF